LASTLPTAASEAVIVSAGVFRDEPVLGIYYRDGTLTATALVSLSTETAQNLPL
jgi:hypothetical protein